ncbi:hypothetical protein FNYG_08477 [Fusarium nygamai]|uniref:Uncharacterized protein n=1 Tax=Gibberella nygamai TaxID=42673 RepID=A0A2K0W794_GIBNY|nr:hypothetical protein FNYG_08477 [Fusarium nygamai]
MAAEQESQSLNPETKLGKHISDSAKSLLHELLRFTNSRPFNKEGKEHISYPRMRIRLLGSERIVIEHNDQGIPEADMDAIYESGSVGQFKTFDFRKIIAACKKVHLQSGLSSLMFHYNIFDPTDKALYISKRREDISTYALGTRFTLLLHDQGNRKDVETLKNIIHHQFEELHDATLLFLKEVKTLEVEFCGMDEKVYRNCRWEKNEVDEHSLRISMAKSEYGERSSGLQCYHVAEQPLLDLATTVVLAFPLTIHSEPETKKTIVKKLFNFVPLRTWSHGVSQV